MQHVDWSIFWVALSIMAEKYVNNEKKVQVLCLKTSIFQIFRKIVKWEWLKLCFTIVFHFFKKRSYTKPLPYFRRKLKKVQQDIVQQPGNCINKTKRDVKKKINDLEEKYPAFSEFHLEKLDRFVGGSKISYCQRCIFWKILCQCFCFHKVLC